VRDPSGPIESRIAVVLAVRRIVGSAALPLESQLPANDAGNTNMDVMSVILAAVVPSVGSDGGCRVVDEGGKGLLPVRSTTNKEGLRRAPSRLLKIPSSS
jgi:hypothetical protein